MTNLCLIQVASTYRPIEKTRLPNDKEQMGSKQTLYKQTLTFTSFGEPKNLTKADFIFLPLKHFLRSWHALQKFKS